MVNQTILELTHSSVLGWDLKTNPLDFQALCNFTHACQLELLDRWLSYSHDNFEQFLRLLDQKVTRLRRSTISLSNESFEIIYNIGIICGSINTFRELFRKEQQDAQISTYCASLGSEAKAIGLEILRILDTTTLDGVRHLDLANSLKITCDALVAFIEPLLKFNIVTHVGVRENTRYYLTTRGKKYLQENRSTLFSCKRAESL